MYPFGGIILAPIVAGYAASVLCRLCARASRRAGFLVFAVSVVLGVVMSVVATFGRAAFFPGDRTWNKAGYVGEVMPAAMAALLLGAFAAAVVLHRHRRLKGSPVQD
jgi:uncharacterized PurR-regulated membrane protein YhhQ (DUF165 family)